MGEKADMTLKKRQHRIKTSLFSVLKKISVFVGFEKQAA